MMSRWFVDEASEQHPLPIVPEEVEDDEEEAWPRKGRCFFFIIFNNDFYDFGNNSFQCLFGRSFQSFQTKGPAVGETVLVTGGCGFIGRHVNDELRDNGYHVRILDSFVEQVHGADTRPNPNDEVLVGDVRDAELVGRALTDADYVIHLAAEVGVGQSMYEVARYVGANDLGTAVLLDAIARRPVKGIVVASSMSVYGEGRYEDRAGRPVRPMKRNRDDLRRGEWGLHDRDGHALHPVPTDEDKPVDLASIYALTKYAQERSVLLMGEAYDIPATALRLFNVFGAGQALSNPYTGVLANFASRLANGQRPTIFEDGEQQRDFVHVRDVARAFRLAMESPKARGQVINIGSGRAYTIARVAQLLAAAMDLPDRKPEILGKYRSGDIRNCFADIGRARALIGFDPTHFLETSLGQFVRWVRETESVDHGEEMRRHLEERGLVA